MPGYDGTGPMGMGPRTGGGFGYCPPAAGGVPAGGVVRGLGRGGLPWGGGRGFGGGRGRGYGRGMRGAFGGVAPYAYGPVAAPQPTAEQETQWLRGQADAIRQELAGIEQRLSELEQGGSDDA